jgi:hypothetical protein
MAARAEPLIAGLTPAAGSTAGRAGPALPSFLHAGTADRVPDIVGAARAGGESGPQVRFGGSGTAGMCGHGPTKKRIEAAEVRLHAGKAKNRTPSATSKNRNQPRRTRPR